MIKWLNAKLAQRNLKKQAEALNFPMEVKGWWYTGKWYMYQRELARDGETDIPIMPLDGKFMFNPKGYGLKKMIVFSKPDKSRLIEDKYIPAIRNGGMVGLYKVERKYREYGSDPAYWDDQGLVDMRLVRVEDASEDFAELERRELDETTT